MSDLSIPVILNEIQVEKQKIRDSEIRIETMMRLLKYIEEKEAALTSQPAQLATKTVVEKPIRKTRSKIALMGIIKKLGAPAYHTVIHREFDPEGAALLKDTSSKLNSYFVAKDIGKEVYTIGGRTFYIYGLLRFYNDEGTRVLDEYRNKIITDMETNSQLRLTGS